MSYYFDRNSRKIVTVFDRRSLAPAMEDTYRPATGNIPETIYFRLNDGTTFAVDTRQEIIIGRQARPDDPPVTIDLARHHGHEKGVSRQHVMIKDVQNCLMLCDLDSINGTFINAKRAMPLKRYALLNGDTVRVGRIELTLSFKAPTRT
jgi:pSer/pThr/pTyr-binding forkhead associated (FHA) protein